ncbi:hypothetical protein FRC08_000448 [Ceratobasidium sp. 394]|nr:hypothetical protein FRC08_000448 [Ceratobasidium sp. 394]KAG9083616.1 hypothetical protein FS749_005891 [Ceratobasidium sp. UAMH 11750]
MEQANNPTPELFQEYDTAGKSKPASTTPALPCALGIGKEEAADLKVIEELKLMGNLLATAVQRYLDASHMLRSISSPHSLGSKKFTPVLQALNALDEQLVHLQSHRAKLDQAHAAVSLV